MHVGSGHYLLTVGPVCIGAMICMVFSQALRLMWLPEVLGFIQAGAESNWWGLLCPAHCSGSSFQPRPLLSPGTADWHSSDNPLPSRVVRSSQRLSSLPRSQSPGLGRRQIFASVRACVTNHNDPDLSSAIDRLATSIEHLSLAIGFPALPNTSLALRRHLSSSGSTPVFRATRAWKARFWAKAVLEGQVPTPRPSDKLPPTIRPKEYSVLRCKTLFRPSSDGSFSPRDIERRPVDPGPSKAEQL